MWLLFMRTCSYIDVCGKSQLNKYAKNSLLSDGLIVETSWKFSLRVENNFTNSSLFESHYGSFDRPLEIACFYPFRVPREFSIIVNHTYICT